MFALLFDEFVCLLVLRVVVCCLAVWSLRCLIVFKMMCCIYGCLICCYAMVWGGCVASVFALVSVLVLSF